LQRAFCVIREQVRSARFLLLGFLGLARLRMIALARMGETVESWEARAAEREVATPYSAAAIARRRIMVLWYYTVI
jgi:hypothetical protein